MIKKNDKRIFKSNFVFFISLIFYFLNVISFFILKVNFRFKDCVYRVSCFEVLVRKGILSNADVVLFPLWLKFLICVSFLGGMSSIIFLIRKKLNESLVLISLFILPYLFFIIQNLFFKGVQILDLGVVLLGLFVSLTTIILFLSCFKLERACKLVLRVETLFCVSILLLITAYMVFSGLPAIFRVGCLKFLFGQNWSPLNNEFGILPFVCCSLVVTVGSIVIGVPIGVLTSVFLSEFTNPIFARIMNSLIKLLAGIPSVVFGFFGMLVVVPLVKKVFRSQTTGDCLLTSIVILSIMILPTITSISESSIRAASRKYLEPSLALGESKARSIFKVVIPAAKNGIVSGTFLGLGKALGETMAVIMVSGNAVNMPNLLKSSRFLTTAMALEFSYASGLHRQVLFSIGLILFIIIVVINLIFMKILKNGGE